MNQISGPQPAAGHEHHTGLTPADHAAAPDRHRTGLRLALLTGAVLAAVIGWGTWTHLARQADAEAALAARQAAIPEVRTVVASAVAGPRIVDLPGTMEAFDSATLYARATGYIGKRNVDIGSKVHAGDVLAIISAPDLDQQLAQAQAQLGQMQAALVQAQATS